MESEADMPIPKDEEIIWPRGRQPKKLIPKFGSNRPPAAIPGRKKNKHDTYQNE